MPDDIQKFPFYVLLPEYLDAGITYLDWHKPVYDLEDLSPIINYNSARDDYRSLEYWVRNK